MMGCLKETRLLLYLDDELTSQKRSMVEAHLKDCSGCTDRFASLQRRVRNIREKMDLVYPKGDYFRPFFIPDEPIRLRRRLIHRIRESIRIPVPVLATLSLLILVLAGSFFWQQKKIHQLKVDLANMKRGAMLYRVVNNEMKSLLLKADLSEFRPIRNPKIYVEREGESEL